MAAYSIEQEGEKWCVYNNETKAKEGEFDSRMEAMKKMKELYRSGGDSKKAKKQDEDMEEDE